MLSSRRCGRSWMLLTVAITYQFLCLNLSHAFKFLQPIAKNNLGAYDVDSLRPVIGWVDPANQVEMWCVDHLEEYYTQSLQIKCPFFRRRAADMLDAVDAVLRFLIIRHKTLIDAPLGLRATYLATAKPKSKDLSPNEIFQIILHDWKLSNDKGYYITGRLNTTVYRDDCVFDGPDPDMPVKGLRKYLNAASQLFDYADSFARLDSLKIVNDKQFIATWKMEGVLRLPWRPLLPEWRGTTTYFLDDDNLIYRHEETWDMSVAEAFVKTFQPQIGYKIWNSDCMMCEEDEDEEEEHINVLR